MADFAIYKTKMGYFKIQTSGGYLTVLDKINHDNIIDFGKKTEFTDKVYFQLTEYFDGIRKEFDIPYKLEGTDFQKKVWKALYTIPYGETRSYKDIATAIGNEKASRAVGMANNKNPIYIIIPCHRVIGSSGELVGYGGGLDMKKSLLDMEKNR